MKYQFVTEVRKTKKYEAERRMFKLNNFLTQKGIEFAYENLEPLKLNISDNFPKEPSFSKIESTTVKRKKLKKKIHSK